MRENGKVWLESESLSDVDIEMPRINYDFNGRKYRFVYGVNSGDFSMYTLYKVRIPL